jgi:hypothetical protein
MLSMTSATLGCLLAFKVRLWPEAAKAQIYGKQKTALSADKYESTK